MHIEHLETVNFRNLDRVAVDLEPRWVVLRGHNAQGKTNALEALYVGATGKSFRRATPKEMLRHGAERGRVVARFVRQGVRHDVEVEITPRRRGVRVDGRGLRTASKLLELVNVVAFFPDDLRIAKGSPEERRRFLDRAVANQHPELLDATLAYGKALEARNALLKADRLDRNFLAVYDEQLVTHGLVIHRCREEALADLRPLTRERFTRVMGGEASGGPRAVDAVLASGLGLGPGNNAGGDSLTKESFTEALHRSYPRDRARGLTSVGPHRADLLLSVDGQPAREFASQGQQRALVLALKLAEVSVLERRLGSAPILLLDDVSSELDAARTRILFEVITEIGGQVWVSTTGAAALPLPPGAQLFEVAAGTLSRAAS